METSLDLEAMALQMPYVAKHPNRTEFHGVLTLVDSVSDRAPSSGVGYVELEISAAPGDVAIEQFDVAASDRVAFAYGDGWMEQELDPKSGERWRWLSEVLTIVVIAAWASASNIV